MEKSPSPVYGARLELVYGLIAHRGFESLLLRHFYSNSQISKVLEIWEFSYFCPKCRAFLAFLCRNRAALLFIICWYLNLYFITDHSDNHIFNIKITYNHMKNHTKYHAKPLYFKLTWMNCVCAFIIITLYKTRPSGNQNYSGRVLFIFRL